MRWFKHMTDASFNRKITAVEDELGLLGSGLFWRIMEIVGAQLDEKRQTFAEHSAKTWGNFCRVSAKKFTKYGEILKKNDLILIEKNQNFIRINIPNILEYMDETTRKMFRNSGMIPESFRNDSGPDIDQNRREEEKRREEGRTPLPPTGGEHTSDPPDPSLTPRPADTSEANPPRPPASERTKQVYSQDFERFWAAYPRKQSKNTAMKAWSRLKKAHILPPLEELLEKIEAQARSPDWQKNAGQYIPLPATWLNGHRWLDETKTTGTMQADWDFLQTLNREDDADEPPDD